MGKQQELFNTWGLKIFVGSSYVMVISRAVPSQWSKYKNTLGNTVSSSRLAK